MRWAVQMLQPDGQRMDDLLSELTKKYDSYSTTAAKGRTNDR